MAKYVSIPINSKPFQSIDEIGLTNLSDVLLNGFIEESKEDGITVKRLGLDVLKDIGSFKKIDGLFWWEQLQIIIVVSDGSVYKITDSTGSLTDLTSDKLEADGRVSFAQNGTTLVMANGGRMVYTDGTTLTTFVADADAPILVTHVAFLDQWLLANKTGMATFFFADFTGAPTTWLAINVFSAEAHPDNLIALYVNKRTIILPGTESIEFWGNDGVTPFVRLQGTTTARGAMAKHSTVFANEVGFYWDDRRRFVRIDGTQITILSTPFDKTVQAFTTVNDCLADYITVQGRHFVRFQFPTENRTLMYDIAGDYWFEWTFWNNATAVHERFLGESYCYARGFNLHVFGSRRDSNVYKMTNTSYADNGVDIHLKKISGHIDHDTPQEKISYDATLRLKTGNVLSGNTQATALLSWRDDGAQGFSNPREMKLKFDNDTQFIHRENDLGSYSSRQWKIEHSDPVPFAFGKMIERVEVLDV